jgi:hypothetical protein
VDASAGRGHASAVRADAPGGDADAALVIGLRFRRSLECLTRARPSRRNLEFSLLSPARRSSLLKNPRGAQTW